jgi:NitT/TauT family transport system substrate-binding protein
VYTKHEFAEKNPKTAQALVNALYNALKFIQKSKPEEMAASVPEEY